LTRLAYTFYLSLSAFFYRYFLTQMKLYWNLLVNN
jgi:hypothetical protein